MRLVPFPAFTRSRSTPRDRIVQVIGPVPGQLHELLVHHGARTIACSHSKTVYAVPATPRFDIRHLANRKPG